MGFVAGPDGRRERIVLHPRTPGARVVELPDRVDLIERVKQHSESSQPGLVEQRVAGLAQPVVRRALGGECRRPSLDGAAADHEPMNARNQGQSAALADGRLQRLVSSRREFDLARQSETLSRHRLIAAGLLRALLSVKRSLTGIGSGGEARLCQISPCASLRLDGLNGLHFAGVVVPAFSFADRIDQHADAFGSHERPSLVRQMRD